MVSTHDHQQPDLGEPEGQLPGEAIAWFTKLTSQEMTRRERTEFQGWRNRSPAHEAAFQEICTLWDKPELIEAVGTLARRAERPVSLKPDRRWSLAMATAAVLLLVTTAWYQFDLPLRLQADYVTATGERHSLVLSDRSTILMNTNSAVASEMRTDKRVVRLLKGEALFRVEPDRTRPFVVTHAGFVARAVGTEFVVREQGAHTHVSVTEGVVSIESEAADLQPVTVTAGHRAIIASDGAITVHPLDRQVALAWLDGRLVFENASFADALAELSRYHAGYLGIWNPALTQLTVSGTYNLSDTTRILSIWTKTLPVHMTRMTDRFIVFR